ncbi:hypothetical protein QNH39_13150 [Neobacillus novalis]|uniref:Uncharacterized protein n=1 Tax=Neobacillus novalis TaxID=220687 RepID=A0AA95MW08_9BACI|nr:hypothetical protein [Neobacillus novalis]WHY88718.1 hypothetical protein QNH39_13150 [Neobacillus novalis]
MQNIGVDFKLRVYSQRWGHRDNIYLKKTENGWSIVTLKLRGVESDKHGAPGIIKAFESESISYPADIGYFLSDLWDASQIKSEEEIQRYFDQLADWISHTEETKPNFGPLHI